MTSLDAQRSADSEPHRRAQLRADHVEHFQKRTESQWVLTVGKKAKKRAAPLATADIGIAIGGGADVVVVAGHCMVLVWADPRDIPRIITLSRATYRKTVQNRWWAAGYIIFAIPLTAGVLALWGILLTPAVGAILMSASMVVVAINAQLLQRVEL